MRRQHGLLGYFNGVNLTYNYEFAFGPWNDFESVLYRPMVIAYRNYGGIVDTIQWEGYREAIDDIRYMTKLQQEIKIALASGDIDRKLQAKKAQQYLATLDPKKMDLNAVRMEVIHYISKLMNLAEKKTK